MGYAQLAGIKITGKAVAHCGAAMAGADIFIITVEGNGGHAAMPHLTNDPVAATGMIIVSLQNLVSRQLDPFDQAVISLTLRRWFCV